MGKESRLPLGYRTRTSVGPNKKYFGMVRCERLPLRSKSLRAVMVVCLHFSGSNSDRAPSAAAYSDDCASYAIDPPLGGNSSRAIYRHIVST
jgi:hypothetical protein